MRFPTEAPSARGKLFRLLGSLAAAVLIAAVAYFFYRELAANWTQFLEYPWEIRYSHVAVSLAVLFVVFAISPLAWVEILRLQGQQLPRAAAFVIYYLANLGKYIPGKLWGYGGQVYLTKRQGVELQHILVSTVVLLVLDYFAGLAFFFVTTLSWPSVPTAASVGGALAVTGLVYVLSKSERALGALKKGLRRIRVTALDQLPPGNGLFGVWAFLLVRWFLLGASFAIGIKALVNTGLTDAVAYSGAFTISHLLSMLVVVTPAGLGVREGLNVYFLNLVADLPLSVVIGISVAARLWMTIMELICALPAVAAKKLLR